MVRLNQMGNPVGDDARLAAAGSRQQQAADLRHGQLRRVVAD